MRENSSNFTAQDVPRFMGELAVAESRNLAARLRRASERMNELAARVPDEPRGDGEWNAKEILAHVVVLSHAYGIFSYMIATGRLPELNLGDVISQRDAEGDKYMAMTAAECAAEATKQHQRTLKFLESATPEQLQRQCRVEDGVVTAESIIRLPLVVHLEEHLAEMEKALA
ncbi:MAG: DinB family protein [Candidatus Dormibacteria bacterium]